MILNCLVTCQNIFCYFSLILRISEVVRQKGLEHTAVDDLVAEITPKGRGKFHVFLNFHIENMNGPNEYLIDRPLKF